jgi:acetolactate synthase-1/2/3 large subunit
LARFWQKAFSIMTSGRPGPVHIEIPTDVMKLPAASGAGFEMPLAHVQAGLPRRNSPSPPNVRRSRAIRPSWPVAARCGLAHALRRFAEALDAPVISTVNARGIMAGHGSMCRQAQAWALCGKCWPADLVLALGTELGPTDTRHV